MSALSEAQCTQLRDRLLNEIIGAQEPLDIEKASASPAKVLAAWTRRNFPEDHSNFKNLQRSKKVTKAATLKAFSTAVQKGAQKMIHSVEWEYQHTKIDLGFSDLLANLESMVEENKEASILPSSDTFEEEEDEESGFIVVNSTIEKIKNQTIELLKGWEANPFSLIPQKSVAPFLIDRLKQ